MTASLRKVADELLQLPPGERLELAEALYISATKQNEVDEAWEKEIERRVEDYEAGRTEIIPSEEVHTHLEEIIREARRVRSASPH